eukprot:TRINITY_DN6919_c1_g1_i3.p1 TRINITY_DN6919_c1_g1~~TRINITY_DN6919_c1_g1_i3.p1  ORF type:complete len:218 (-),score=-8.04 TRINITY_DN6919_c1_g1_i3:11-664(-)
MCVYILTNIETFCKFFQNVSNVTMFLLIQLSSTMLFVPNKLSSHKNTQTNLKKKVDSLKESKQQLPNKFFEQWLQIMQFKLVRLKGYIQIDNQHAKFHQKNQIIIICLFLQQYFFSVLTQQLLFQLYDLSCIQYTSERFAINQVKILRFLIVPANQNLNVQYVKKLENLNQQDKFWINSLEVFQSVCNPFLFQDIFFQIAIHFEQKKSTQILCCKAF